MIGISARHCTNCPLPEGSWGAPSPIGPRRTAATAAFRRSSRLRAFTLHSTFATLRSRSRDADHNRLALALVHLPAPLALRAHAAPAPRLRARARAGAQPRTAAPAAHARPILARGEEGLARNRRRPPARIAQR